MITALALLLAAPAAPVALPAANEPEVDIVVVARRLDRIAFNVAQDREGSWHCSMNGSSGNPKLDSRMCKEVTDCVRKKGAADAQVKACVTGTKEKVLARFRKEMARRK
ncbi:hypothetical protein [Alteriqipengyuania lutimaris]|uniref:UrcA family protein n=1 Tax=Alteriqipengyuania lutimaris TaxID=1538146 RepID=A0A395LKD3_9SPHN|nr:hypothetical protein [Alteriqipengyuania lutimaris]MBB3034285.1 hypothetical protein [Alteriqipengyuania lutimaris]RDS76807.1 hypothetical protein DL238_03735 [Alteriqipengyuania lutimaris]